jgi:hypothetical protein
MILTIVGVSCDCYSMLPRHFVDIMWWVYSVSEERFLID